MAMTGIVDIASAISPSVAVRTALLARFLPMEARQGARLAAAFAGFVLVTLATNLWRRKHMAWLLVIILLGISATSHLLKGLDYEEAVLSIVIMVWLWHLRHYFYAKSDSPSIVQGLRTLIYALTFTLAYGTAGFYLLDRHFKIHFDFWSAVKQTVVMFARFYDPGLQPVTAYGQRFADSIYVLGAVSMVYAIIMVFRPVLVRKPASEEETAHAKQIVERWGRSSLARLTLLPDKSYLFTADGSVIAYVLNNRVALTLGDPIGPPQSIPAAICEFRELCLRNDWYPAFYQTLPEYLEHYKAAGFDTLRIGQEAIVRLSSFTLEGKSGRRLRPSVNRLVKTGHFTLLHEPPLSDGLLDQLHIISDEWLRHVKGSEKRFSLGWFDDDYIRSCPVMTVHASDGTAVAFANIMTEYQLNEITVDLMRYSRRAEPGTMDFLFVSLLEWAKEKGYESFNLGLSPLAGVGQRSEDPMIERAMHFIYEHLGQFYSYKGLYSFKSKFNPTWEDRYLVYPGSASLPTVVISVIQADSGGNLILGYLRKAIWQRAMTYPPTGTET